MTRLTKIFSLIILSGILLISVSGQAAFFTAQGKQIADTTGTPVLLRGMGLGGWLVPEGYMMHVPGYGSPSFIDSLVEDLIGTQNRDHFWQLYRQNYVREADIDSIAAWGFNSIRLPFHYKLFYDPDSQSFRPDGFALVDTLLAWCRPAGLFLILDMHCAPGGQNKDNISDSDGIEARLWTEPANQTLTIKIWKKIAAYYAAEKQIIGYDLLNEPVLPNGYSAGVLRSFYSRLADSIRTVDSNHILFIEGNWYATDFTQLTPPFDTNLVYSFHKYWGATTTGSIQYLLDIRNQYNVPLWMGESGENSNHWYWHAVYLFEQNNIGWSWWTHKKIATITSPLSAPLSAEYQVVLNYWNGSGGRPTRPFATNALLGMAQSLALPDCEPRPGVIRALFDPDFGSLPKPFAALHIPGSIDAVQYDYGANSVGYADADFQNTGGAGATQWNNGWQYRNDGVDIEHCTDPHGAAYNVGWIEDNEWLKYTVQIAQEGDYQVDFRVASNGGGGKIRLYLDTQIVGGDLNIGATGGWQNWVTRTLYGIHLPAGTHTLYLSFPQGGFNLNRTSFSLTTPIQNEPAEPVTTFALHQNYPNPFNALTVISYSIPRAGTVRMRLFDVTGKEVRSLFSGRQNAGSHRLKIDLSNLSSGIYFYRLRAGQRIAQRKLLLVK